VADEVTRYERRGPAGWITLASPRDAQRALDTARRRARARLAAAIDDPAVRAIVLTGEGPAFCAGADLKNRGAMGETDAGNPFVGILRQMRHGPKPVIVAANGHAFGGGVGLVAAADIAIAVDTAVFSFSEVRIGAIPAMISVVVLPEARRAPDDAPVPDRRALPGRPRPRLRPPATASVAPGGSKPPCRRRSPAIAQGGPKAIREAKQLVRTVASLPEDEAFRFAEKKIACDLRLRGGRRRDGRVRAEAAAPLGQ
jgi:methylglutaconyl-CoA hydratase